MNILKIDKIKSNIKNRFFFFWCIGDLNSIDVMGFEFKFLVY